MVEGFRLCRVHTINPGKTVFIKSKRKKFFFNLENEEETVLKYNQIIDAKGI